MTQITLEQIRDCLEGGAPATIATCGVDGTPNVSLLSHVQYVDSEHVALTYQFFNKTRHNILANPYAAVQVMDPVTTAEFRMSLRFLRTETTGPLFEQMRARLAGIAAHCGMQSVFALRGADLYRVLEIDAVQGAGAPSGQPSRPSLLPAVRATCSRLSRCLEMDEAVEETLDCLTTLFGIGRSMLFCAPQPGGSPSARLFAVSSRGFDSSGAGFEVGPNDGIVGVSAREQIPIRISHVTVEYSYSRATAGSPPTGGTDIPFPGLTQPASQMAVPILAGGRLYGVLYVESEEDCRFRYDHEDALSIVASQLGAQMALRAATPPSTPDPSKPTQCPHAGGAPVHVRHYAVDDSIFLDGYYLIKGIAGAILRKILRDHLADGRCDFSNRELRLSPDLRLPEISDNLEARLILLQRRLADRSDAIALVRTGRGRLRLVLRGAVHLDEQP